MPPRIIRAQPDVSKPRFTVPRRVRLLKHRTHGIYMPSLEVQSEENIDNLLRSLRSEIMSIPDRNLQEQWAEAMGDVAKDGDMSRMLELSMYKRKAVDMDTFLFSRTYLGLKEKELFPGVVEALFELDSDQYNEAVLKGAIGGGKSTTANIGIPRAIYKLSCMRNPQATFGVIEHSSIVFTIQSVRLSTAKKAVFEEMGKYINASPFFNEIYKYDRRITSSMIFRDQNVIILPVSSSDTGAISMNVIGGILDEMNFMAKVAKSKHNAADDEGVYDQAKSLYEILSRRHKSRFTYHGKLPGIFYLISSSRYPDDFTEVKAAEAKMMGGPDERIYVFSKSLWESKGRDRYSAKSFRVLIGDERTKSRILDDDETVSDDQEILEVPEDFRADFIKDVNGAIRDFGGRTTLASRPFIHDREALYDCMTAAEEYGYQSVIPLESVDLTISVPNAIDTRVRTDVKQMRVAHVDLAITRDSAGIAVGHIAGTKTIERRNHETGITSIEVLPIIAYDLVLRVTPPMNGEIDFSKIRQILYHLRDDMGIPIKVITTDGFQSTDFRQILAKKRFATEYVSVDRTVEPYKTLKDALYDRRVFLPRHQYLIKELTELEYVRQGAHEKIDHKPRGSKDVADAVCAVASYLLTRRGSWTTQPSFQGKNGIMLHGNRTSMPTVKLQEIDEKAFETLYINGRAVIQSRHSPSRKGTTRRKIS